MTFLTASVIIWILYSLRLHIEEKVGKEIRESSQEFCEKIFPKTLSYQMQNRIPQGY